MQTVPQVDKAVEKYVIVLDTCFAMQESFDEFLQKYKPLLLRNHLLVPYRIIQELNRILQLRDDREKAAAYAVYLIDTAIKDGIAEYRRDPQDDHVVADAVISRAVEGILPRRDMLVLTHDANLTQYLRTKTQQQSFRVKDLIVAGVNSDGELFAWGDHRRNGNGRRDGNGKVRRVQRRRDSGGSSGPTPFALTSTLAASLGTPLSTRQPVREGEALFLKDGSRIVLRHPLASGGEGTIYELDDQSSLCKVYYQNKLTVDRQEKIELMLTRTISDPMICWPRAAAYDSDRVFRGFIMPRAAGKPVPLGHSLFIPAAFLKAHLSWTRKESAQLAMTILRKIRYLHDMNVLIGDINPLNILMQDEKTVYFVDCDSYQVEGYPCPVGTVNFTAPEIQGADFRQFLRTKEQELFSVATLLFMIFMPGKPPYSHQGGEDGAANIKKMHFPYALGERKANAAPEGPWRLCWSHLTKKLKDEFNNCFHEDNRDKTRTTIDRWLQVIDWYCFELSQKDQIFQGPVRNVGYDLSVLPENMRRVLKDGEIKPAWPLDNLTDRERVIRKLVAEADGTAPSTSGGRRTARVSQGRHTGQPNTFAWGVASTAPPPAPLPTPTYTLPANSGGYGSSSKGRSAGWKWVIGILVTVAVAAIAGLVLYYLDPIVTFLINLFTIVFWGAIIIGALWLFSKKT